MTPKNPVGAGFKPAPTMNVGRHDDGGKRIPAGAGLKPAPALHHRRSIRLRGYDYTLAGAYFVTICTQARVCLFGDIVVDKMRLNAAGQLLQAAWDALPDHYPHVELDEFVIMPNHVHGIIVLNSDPAVTTTRHGLPEIVRALKTFSSRHINEQNQTEGVQLWQRNYWEHVIREESELNSIREYIQNNPLQWEMDQLNPAKTSAEDAIRGNNDANPAIRGNVGAGFKPAPNPGAVSEKGGFETRPYDERREA